MLGSQLTTQKLFSLQLADLQFITELQLAGSPYRIARFSLVTNITFSKIKMFKILFILFVTKQLLDKVTSDIDIYSVNPSII